MSTADLNHAANAYCLGYTKLCIVDGFVLRIKDQDRRVYAGLHLYIGIRREWQKGSKLFFVERERTREEAEDVITGSGVFEKTVEVDVMGEQERRLCLQNNWYGKIIFEYVERFLPPVPVHSTTLASTRPALLHGLAVTGEQTAEIDNLVSSRIIS